MLEQSYGLTFFLKSPREKSRTIRLVYVRITVDGISKECSTKRQWDVTRWNQKEEKAIGTKEDAKELNFFLDSFRTKINSHRTELLNNDKLITATDLIDFVKADDGSMSCLADKSLNLVLIFPCCQKPLKLWQNITMIQTV